MEDLINLQLVWGNLKTEKSPFDLEFGRSLAQENIFGGLGRVWIYIAKDELCKG